MSEKDWEDDEFWMEINTSMENRMHDRVHQDKVNACEWWLVAHTRVPIRDSPATDGKVIDVLRQGALLRTSQVLAVKGTRWLRVHDEERERLPVLKRTRQAWMLIDGEGVGLGQLLSPAPPEIDWSVLAALAPADRAAPAAVLIEKMRPTVEREQKLQLERAGQKAQQTEE